MTSLTPQEPTAQETQIRGLITAMAVRNYPSATGIIEDVDIAMQLIEAEAIRREQALAQRVWSAHTSKKIYAGDILFDTLRPYIWDESKNDFIHQGGK